MGKDPKVKDFAELERRATTKPWVRLKLAPFLSTGGGLLAFFCFYVISISLWLGAVGLAVGIACFFVGIHDEDIRDAKKWHDRVLNGPSEKLKTNAARSLRSWRLVAFPAVCVTGWLSVVAAISFGFFIPEWSLVVWMIAFMVSMVFFMFPFAIIGERCVLGKIEAYQRGQEQEQAEFDGLKLEIMEILIENQADFPDLEDPIEILHAKTMKGVVEMLEDTRNLAEEVKADDETPEYARELAEKVLTKLKRMRELAGA